MDWFCTEEERAALKSGEQRLTVLFRASAGLTVLVFIVMCLLIHTENMDRMHWVLMAVTAGLGWICIFLYTAAREARVQLGHLDMLRDGEPVMKEGVLTVTGEMVRIPKSIRIRKVLLDTGKEEPERLNLDERWVSRMPPSGSGVRLAVVHSYISGVEAAEPAQGKKERFSPWRAVLRKTGELLPLLGIWAIAAVFFSSFVFYRITDTDPAHKITIYMDGEVEKESELAAQLEKELGDPVRMVRIHPFRYAMFGSEELKSADLYIVPDSGKDLYAEWFAPGEESIPVYDPEESISVGERWFQYDSGEIYRLYIGAHSPHLEDGLARKAMETLAGTGTEEGTE